MTSESNLERIERAFDSVEGDGFDGVFEFEGDLIVRVRMFRDQASALEAAE